MGAILSSPTSVNRPHGEMLESEAWEIAMAWAPYLTTTDTSVGLAIDRDSSAHSIVDQYAWVRFQLPYVMEQHSQHEVEKVRHAALVAHAAARTWAVLSCCRGYSGREHPTFWRRVFCALQPKIRTVGGPLHQPKDSAVRDAIGFFNGEGLTFPRFMLAFQGRVFFKQVEAAVEVFSSGTLSMSDQELHIQTTLNKLLARLGSFQEVTPRRMAVDLCVALPSSVLARMESIMETLNRTAQIHSNFHLQQLRFDGLIKFDNDQDTEQLSQVMNSSRVPLGPLAISSNVGDTTTAGFAHVLQSILFSNGNIHRHVTTSTTLSFQYDRLADTNYQALFSALPFASSIYSVRLSVRAELRPFELRELPWIAYAIFHPRASQSSWDHLELRDLMLTPKAQHVLTAMAQGNNLLALLTGDDPTSDEYATGVLGGGSAVYTQPSDSAVFMITIAENKSMTVDLCGVSSASDWNSRREWVAVVVPAYGLGWVRSSSIRCVRRYPPARSQLVGLRLCPSANIPSSDATGQQASCESVLPFIQALGSNLTRLDISTFGAIPNSTMQRLVVACPSLTVLEVEATGEAWTSTGSSTKLREFAIKLTSQKDLEMLSAFPADWLRQLQALRLSVPKPKMLQRNRAAIMRLLTNASTLQYIHWQCDSKGPTQPQLPLTYGARRHQSAVQLQLLQLPHGTTLLCAEGPFRVQCATAVLSVVAQKRRESNGASGAKSHSALSRLNPDVLRNIFEFATSLIHRTICIEDAQE